MQSTVNVVSRKPLKCVLYRAQSKFITPSERGFQRHGQEKREGEETAEKLRWKPLCEM